MKTFDLDDEVTIYFVIYSTSGTEVIDAWTTSKALVKAYTDFHKCKHYKVKSITGEYKSRIVPIINECVHDEIQLVNIFTRSPEKPNKYIQVTIPITQNRITLLHDERASMLGSRINYTLLNAATPFLKKRWKKALETIHLTNVIDHVIYNKPSEFTSNVHLDDLMILFKSLPDYFGI